MSEPSPGREHDGDLGRDLGGGSGRGGGLGDNPGSEAAATPGRSRLGLPAAEFLQRPTTRGLLVSTSLDPESPLTFVVPGSAAEHDTGLVVKIPATAAGGDAVERERRMLMALQRMRLGPVARTVPRYVESLTLDGLPVLVTTALAGQPMSVEYDARWHTLRPGAVRRDLGAAAAWLAAFQGATAAAAAVVPPWPERVADDLRGRWDGHPLLNEALSRVAVAGEALAGVPLPACAVHGDFWFAHVLVEGRRVVGVVDWQAGSPQGSPLRDLARFALAYGQHLVRHARPGRTVPGLPGLRNEGAAPGVRYVLESSGWLPDLVRAFLIAGLARLGVPPEGWYPVALVGIAEVAATAEDEAEATDHLTLLAGLPDRSPRLEAPVSAAGQ